GDTPCSAGGPRAELPAGLGAVRASTEPACLATVAFEPVAKRRPAGARPRSDEPPAVEMPTRTADAEARALHPEQRHELQRRPTRTQAEHEALAQHPETDPTEDTLSTPTGRDTIPSTRHTPRTQKLRSNRTTDLWHQCVPGGQRSTPV